MKYLALLLLVACHNGKLQPFTKCGHPCYILDAGEADVGACRSGVWSCPNDDETQAVCVNQVGPSPEVCDGIDNDCDGWTDVNLYKDCSNPCGWGRAICTNGVWGDCTAPQPKPEVCDGIDNDCDGLIDEPQDLPVEFCYDAGIPGTLQHGPCRPGVARCMSGKKICTGQVGPVPEVCNGIDDNCNGQVDEGLTGVADVVFIADCAGEDFGDTLHLMALINDLAIRYGGDSRYRFAWVCTTQRGNDGTPYVYQNFSDPSDIDAGDVWPNTDDLDSEPNLDALKLVADFNSNLGLKWRPGSKRFVFLLTDECIWTLTNPPTTVQDVQVLVDQDKLHVFIYTMPNCYSGFGNLTDQDGGFGDVSDLPVNMEVRLEGALDLICQ